MTICARVQPSAGLNVVADVPLVTPFSTAHATAPAQKESAATSVKLLTVLGAVPSARYRNVTLCAVDAEGAICHAVGNSELTAKRLVEYALEHHKIGVEGQTMVIIDECQIIFNCRDFGRKDRGAWVTLFSQHRKLNNYSFGGLLISLTGMTWFVAIEYWYGGNKLMLSKQIFAYHKKYSKVYDSYKLFSDMVSAGGDVCAGGNRASGGAPGNGGPDAHDQQVKKRLMRRLVAVLIVIQNSQPGTAAAAEL